MDPTGLLDLQLEDFASMSPHPEALGCSTEQLSTQNLLAAREPSLWPCFLPHLSLGREPCSECKAMTPQPGCGQNIPTMGASCYLELGLSALSLGSYPCTSAPFPLPRPLVPFGCDGGREGLLGQELPSPLGFPAAESWNSISYCMFSFCCVPRCYFSCLNQASLDLF